MIEHIRFKAPAKARNETNVLALLCLSAEDLPPNMKNFAPLVTGQLAMPPNAMQSVAGKLITVRHRIAVTLRTGSCITDPYVELPFTSFYQPVLIWLPPPSGKQARLLNPPGM